MLDRLAEALDIDTIQLFGASTTLEERALLHLEKSILGNINKQQQQVMSEIRKTIQNAVKETLSDECKKR